VILRLFDNSHQLKSNCGLKFYLRAEHQRDEGRLKQCPTWTEGKSSTCPWRFLRCI